MRVGISILLSLPLSIMLVGLLAAVLPVPWSSWLVCMLLLVVVLWMGLVVIASLPQRDWPVLAVLAVANVVSGVLLQGTALYGGGA